MVAVKNAVKGKVAKSVETAAKHAVAATSITALYERDRDHIKRSDRYRVDPRLLHIEEGFNIRITSSPESRAQIDSIKASVVAYITKDNPENKIWTGDFLDVFPEIKAFVNKNAKLQVYDGYHRTIALHELMAEGYDFHYVHVDARAVTDLEVRYAMLRSGLGMQHTPLEKALEYANLVNNHGQTITQIAALSGNVTVQRVEQLLLLGNADPEVHKLVLDKKVTADAAIEVLRKFREDKKAGLEAVQKLVASKAAGSRVGRSQVRMTMSKGAQDKLFSAIGAGAKKLSKTLEQFKAEHGEQWESAPVQVELPAAVVAEILARMEQKAETQA